MSSAWLILLLYSPFAIALGSPFPLLVLFVYIGLRNAKPRLLDPIRLVSLIYLAVALAFFFSGWRFIDAGISILLALLAIGSYCFLASSASAISSNVFRVAALFALGAPACIVTFIVCLAALFQNDAPYKSEQIRSDLVCKEGSYGMVGAGGDKIELFKIWPGLPFIEKRVAGDISDDSAPKAKLSSCAELLKEFDDKK